MTRAERRILLIAGLVGGLAPLGAAHHLRAVLGDEVEPALARRLGLPVAIGRAEVGLSGTLRLTDVAVGDLLAVDAIEASLDPGRLLHGTIEVDELRVIRPVLRLAADRDGRARLDALVARLRPRHGSDGHAAAGSPRRLAIEHGTIVVTSDRGELEVDDVELRPGDDALRLTSGAVRARATLGPLFAEARFPRAALELAWPSLAPRRLAAAGGTLRLAGPDGHDLGFTEVALTRGVAGGELALTGQSPGGARVQATARPDGFDASFADVPIAVLAALAPSWVRLAGAQASGQLSVSRDPTGTRASFRGTIEGALLAHAQLASRPIPVDAEVDLALTARRLAGHRFLALDLGRLAVGRLELHGRGELEWSGAGHLPARVALDLTLPTTGCGDALAALPAPLRDRLAGLAASGTVAGRLRVELDEAEPDASLLDVDLDTNRCRIDREPDQADVASLARPFSHRFPDGSERVVGAGPDYVALRHLPAHVAGAFVAAEDARFYDHAGFDRHQLERSLAIDLGAGRLVRGGSTISQQLVKNAFLGPERTLARKLEEAVLTWRLEAVLDKPTILDRYLNLIELGDGVYGVEAGSRHWFGRPARELTVAQAAFLAALTPAPKTLGRRLREAGRVDRDMQRRIDLVLRAMQRGGVIDQATCDAAQARRVDLAPSALAAR